MAIIIVITCPSGSYDHDFGKQPVPAVPGQSRVATRITLCPLQANVKDNDAQLKARGAGKKAA